MARRYTLPVLLKLKSFNIRHGLGEDGPNGWPFRREVCLDEIEKDSADIIGLQEVLSFQLDEIRDRLAGYDFVGVGREDGVAEGEFSPIFYRRDRFQLISTHTFWLSDFAENPGSRTWGNRVTRICTRARLECCGRELLVMNSHWDHESEDSRDKSADQISRYISEHRGEASVILMGDFNCEEHSRALRKLLSRGELKDTFRALHPVGGRGTYHGFTGYATDGIDYILVSSDVEIRDAAIEIGNDSSPLPSDHYPVMAKLMIPVGLYGPK